ncbi:hypothetical protein PFISCL1PPCAC_17802, partial [Pristionchus fissidentatus]
PCGHVICESCTKFLVDNGHSDRKMTDQQDRITELKMETVKLKSKLAKEQKMWEEEKKKLMEAHSTELGKAMEELKTFEDRIRMMENTDNALHETELLRDEMRRDKEEQIEKNNQVADEMNDLRKKIVVLQNQLHTGQEMFEKMDEEIWNLREKVMDQTIQNSELIYKISQAEKEIDELLISKAELAKENEVIIEKNNYSSANGPLPLAEETEIKR